MNASRQRTAMGVTPVERPAEILLIEDTPIEARRTIQALRKGGVQCRVTVVEDGDQALHLLRSPGGYRPDVILLDWYLPKKGRPGGPS